MIGILGGGFGLYGYLPAAAKISQEPILLLNNYKPIINSRPELFIFKDQIMWVESDEKVIQLADSLVICRRPIDQEEMVSGGLFQTNLKRIMFEKPLASTPQNAQIILNEIKISNKCCSVGFNFRYTKWAKDLRDKLLNGYYSEDQNISIRWYFMAHHFSHKVNSWKMDHAQGGGVIRFYGIHLIALLAEWGYDQVIFSNVTDPDTHNHYYEWRACIKGSGLPYVYIDLNSKSNNLKFNVSTDNNNFELFEGDGPFDKLFTGVNTDKEDLRCALQYEALLELFHLSTPFDARVQRCINLWQLVDSKTI
jgi:hypothetical protein